MTKRLHNVSALFATATLLAIGSAAAHHSPAMFDASKEITLEGTVKAFQWTSPHCWIQLLVTNPAEPNAAPVEWGIEMDNPLGLSRNGWKPGSLTVGEQIVVLAHPLRNGTNGAQVISVTRADGTLVGKALAETPRRTP